MTQNAAHTLTDLRLLLRNKIYSNCEYADLLLENIQERFDCTSISFNSDVMNINIKIKKTAMKRAEDYSHSVMYYYPLIQQALSSFLSDERIREELVNCDGNGKSDCSIYENIQSNLLSLFNATTLLDNIIVINL